MNLKNLKIRNMNRPEVDQLLNWAEAEAWSPGANDAECFWQADANAFVAAELNGNNVGGGAITSYDKTFGFMGLFIIRPEFRGFGLGKLLWHARKQRLIDRLLPSSCIGMDGVFNMQSFYAKGGFKFAHRNLRYSIQFDSTPVLTDNHWQNLEPLAHIPVKQIEDYDLKCFQAPRRAFLESWISQPNAITVGYMSGEQLQGYCVMRPCVGGFKVAPLFADSPKIAESLFVYAASFAEGENIYLDVPETNDTAIAMVQKYRMREVFGCARMYFGEPPKIEQKCVFGVTSFELG